MKRVYVSFIIAAALLAVAFYSSWRVESFAQEILASLSAAESAVNAGDFSAARASAASGAKLCAEVRSQMSTFLRVEDFAELEASLRAAEAYFGQQAAEEAMGEVSRAEVQAEELSRLARRYF